LPPTVPAFSLLLSKLNKIFALNKTSLLSFAA